MIRMLDNVQHATIRPLVLAVIAPGTLVMPMGTRSTAALKLGASTQSS